MSHLGVGNLGLNPYPVLLAQCTTGRGARSPRRYFQGADSRSPSNTTIVVGFVRLRGMQNEEPLLSVASAQMGIIAQPDDGTLKADALSYRKIERCDVSAGRPRLSNPDPELRGYPTWLRLGVSEPLILHFNDTYAQRPPYPREALRLRMLGRWPLPLVGPVSWIVATLPLIVVAGIKNILRPAYSSVVGKRPVKSSPRL